MNRPGRVLVVDDEPAMRAILTEELGKDGWDVRAVASSVEALDALENEEWSVVLLDQKLRGPQGPDGGLELIAEVRRIRPDAKPIVITGYATRESVQRAYDEGAYDLIEKTESFETLLRIKVRHTMDALLMQWRASLPSEGADEAARELHAEVISEPDPHRKGRLLEDLVELLLTRVAGFVVTARHRGTDEEFDLLVRNESPDPMWSKEGPYFLVECKNWSARVGRPELDSFTSKLRRRYGRTRLGLFVAVGGFTAGFESSLLASREGNLLVVPVTGDDLRALVNAPDKSEALKELHQRAVVAGNGR